MLLRYSDEGYAFELLETGGRRLAPVNGALVHVFVIAFGRAAVAGQQRRVRLVPLRGVAADCEISCGKTSYLS